MLIAALLGSWALFIGAFLTWWARIHAEARAKVGIDEGAYVNGQEQFPPDVRRAA